MGKKNLDKLFQEKFSDFSEVPEDKVWHSIETALDSKKKSQKIIPFWWKFAGIAAVLAVAVYVINPFKDARITTPAVTDIETPEKKADLNTEAPKFNEAFEKLDTEIVDVNEQNTFEEQNISKKGPSNTTAENNKLQSEKGKAIDFKSSSLHKKNQIAREDVGLKKQKSSNTFNTDPSIESTSILKNNEASVTTIQDKIKSQNSVEKNIVNESQNDDSIKQNNLSIAEASGIAQIKGNEIRPRESDTVTKKSIFDEITAQEQEEEVIAVNKGGKWSAGASIAPIYYDAIGEGSPVHSIFVANSKSGGMNLSYGLLVAYEINDKLKVRSGVHRVDYGYSTNDVEFSSSLESAVIGQIANVSYSATAKNIVVASSSTKSSLASMAEVVAQDFSGQGLSQSGSMTQQFGYLEVPIELEYALVDTKFGVNLIGGISSLFLVDNSISLSSGELTTEMGEANNVNDLNFSTNVGIGLNYKFTSKLQLNVEPVFKYQLNTFSQTDGTFQPFTIGVYSGVSFKF